MDVPELWRALLSGQYDLAYQMISRGANVNEVTKTDGQFWSTLLHYAVMMNDIRCIRVLANLGANFNVYDSWNLTPLHWAVMMRTIIPDVAEVLINEGALVDARDNFQMTPLHHVAKSNDIDSAEKLIARGASINAISADGWSVLHVAVWFQSLEIVKILISHKVITDVKDHFGCTPLLCSTMKLTQKTEITQLLVDNGADVNAKTQEGIFPLLVAAKNKCLDSVCLLLKKGAHVNEATNTGKTALHVVCENGQADMTALLLKFGADLNACNQEGETPFELLPNSPPSEATARVVIREAVKREASGQFLCEGYKQMAQSCETYWRFEQECREEIKRMQSEKIDAEDSAISFFYILSIDEEKLTALARNKTIVTAFESSGYVASFGIYAGELTTKFEVAKKRANLSVAVVQRIAAYVKYGYVNENGL